MTYDHWKTRGYDNPDDLPEPPDDDNEEPEPMSAPDARTLPCDCCDGTGKEFEWHEYDIDGDWLGTWRPGRDACTECGGTGLMIITVEPIEQEDLP